jgi:hypothetical protein
MKYLKGGTSCESLGTSDLDNMWLQIRGQFPFYFFTVWNTSASLERTVDVALVSSFSFHPEGGVDQTQAWMPADACILRIPQMI